MRMRMPPMVGVPAFSMMWRAGPSARMGWPLPCLCFSQRISMGLIRKAIINAVTTAAPERKVRYLNRRKKASWSVWVRSER